MDTVASWKEPTVSSRLQWVAGVNTIDRLASIIWWIVSKVISKNPTEPTVKAQKHLQQQAHLQFTQLKMEDILNKLTKEKGLTLKLSKTQSQ